MELLINGLNTPYGILVHVGIFQGNLSLDSRKPLLGKKR